MHAASVETSERLQRVLDVLNDYREHTTKDIARNADVCAVNSCVAELKAEPNNFKIFCERRGRYWYYRLQSEKVVQFPVAA